MAKGNSGLSGGKGSGGNGAKSAMEQVEDFRKELENREYGNGTKQIPKKQQQEYRDLKREIKNHMDTWGDEEGPIVFSSGFTNSETYVHTNAKLNAYQRIVQREAKDITLDLKLGVINEAQAVRELKILKSIDATIKRRRELLREW